MFVSERVPDDGYEPAFKLLMGIVCVKGRKIEGDKVEMWRFKVF